MITTWMRMGGRNLLKNRRRSLFTIVAVAVGYAAVNLFAGFTVYVFILLRDGFVHAYANGHLAVFREGTQTPGAYQPAAGVMDGETLARLRALVEADPRVRLVSPQLLLTGLVSDGRVSTVFAGLGRVPEDMATIRAQARTFVGRLEMFDGPPLREADPAGIGLSAGVFEKLNLDAGSPVILAGTTVDGQMNAVDAVARHVLDAPSDVLREMLVDMPLGLARSLYATDGADRLIVLLNRAGDTAAAHAALQARLDAAIPGLKVHPWQALCPSYFRLRDTFAVIFVFLFLIVSVIVILGVVNTISMAVFERTREIGSLRALGLKRSGVLVMFAAESGLLGLTGALAGLMLTLGVTTAIRLADVQWHPPVVSREVPLEILLTPPSLAGSLAILVLLSIAAALLPARRAARMGIVDALGHV